jgi:integrase
MSAAFKGRGRRIYEAKLPTETGEWPKRSTGTRDPVRARDIQRMIDALGWEGRRAWDVLSTVTATPARFTLGELYDHWQATPARTNPRTGLPIEPSVDERLEYVRSQLVEGELRTLLTKWHDVLGKPASGVSQDTADHYRAAVRLYFAHVLELEEDDGETPVPLARLSERELRVWIEEMDDVAPATVRKRGIGVHRFVLWLRSRNVIGFDPMREISLPAQGDPLTHYIDTPDVVRLADAAAGQQRLLELVLPGSAMEVSTALGVRVRAVSKEAREIHAPGTKSHNRNRVVRVADYAWDAVLELLKGKHPDSRLFDRIPHRWAASDAHVEAIEALVAKGHEVYARAPDGTVHRYTMRDHRHTWAVRAARSGWPIHAIAEQLGHGDGGVLALKVYGRHLAKREERDRWEQLATARDQALEKEAHDEG